MLQEKHLKFQFCLPYCNPKITTEATEPGVFNQSLNLKAIEKRFLEYFPMLGVTLSPAKLANSFSVNKTRN